MITTIIEMIRTVYKLAPPYFPFYHAICLNDKIIPIKKLMFRVMVDG
jgi:hypothetical protein